MTEAEEKAQKEAIERMQRTPDEVRAGVDVAADDPEYSPISAAEMRGDPVTFDLNGLHLDLYPLKRKTIRTQFGPLVEQWPRVLQFGSLVKSPKIPGIDYDGTAALLTMERYGRFSEQEAEAKKECIRIGVEFTPSALPQPATAADVADEIAWLNGDFDDYLKVICDTTWLLASGTAGLSWPKPPLPEIYGDEDEEKTHDPSPPAGTVWLDDYLEEHLGITDFADLLRALNYANGRFKGSIYDRFTKQSSDL